jgi:hypothetical protein
MTATAEDRARAYLAQCITHWISPGNPEDPWPAPPHGMSGYHAKELQAAARRAGNVIGTIRREAR